MSDVPIAMLARDGYCTVKLYDVGAVERATQAARQFFAQPSGVKRAWLAPPEQEEGYRTHSAAKEMYMVRRRWLPSLLAPVLPAWQQLDHMAASILDTVAGHLHMQTQSLSRLMGPPCLVESVPSASVMRLLHYSPQHHVQVALAPHVDIGLLTLVPRSTHPALQIEVLDARSRRWHEVERGLPPECAVVLAGAALEWCTSNQVRAGTHRVRASGKHRFSLAHHVRPHSEASIAAAAHCGATGGEAASMRGRALMEHLRRGLPSVNASDALS